MKKIYRLAAVLLAAGWLAGSSAWADEGLKNKEFKKTPVAGWSTGDQAKPPAKKSKAVKKGKLDKKTAPVVVEKEVWICPMCRVKADKPGKCPECGMDMVKMPPAEKKK